jgi:HD superfamily phosphohydrolase
MSAALGELKNKETSITTEEELGAKIAILLHDIGHGPYSHALENELIPGTRHEDISLVIMQTMNDEYNGQFQTAIDIFKDEYYKHFFHQLVSGQLDVDRMDYLSRDSFFTGVAEGVISYDRILKMLVVKDDELMIEEKGIYSIEKFLVARRLMYWQVYLHKAVMSAEMLLVKIIRRAKQLLRSGVSTPAATDALNFFLNDSDVKSIKEHLDMFCNLDDYDVMCTIKNWSKHPDKILSTLCRCLVDRRLFKIQLQAEPFDEKMVNEKKCQINRRLGVSEEDAGYFVFTGEAINTTYDPSDERINILFKDGSIRDISKIDNALIHQQLAGPVKKYYICHYRL